MMTFIPSWARAATIRTHRLIKPPHPFLVVVHTNEDAKWYRKTVGPNVAVSGQPYGHAGHRNWILDNLCKRDEWICFADDNISGISKVEEPYYAMESNPTETLSSREWRIRYGRRRANCSWDLFMKLAEQDIAEAERRGAKLIGYATNDNPMFRKVKYRDVGYVSGKLFLMKVSELRMDPKLMSKVDFQFTAENLLHVGRVLINNYLFPLARHFEPGGIGTVEERTPMNLFGCAYLMQKYPGLFRFHDRAGRAPNSEITLTMTNARQVAEWRERVLSGSQAKG